MKISIFNRFKDFIKKIFSNDKTKLIEEHHIYENKNSEKSIFKNQIAVEGIEEKNMNLYKKIEEEQEMNDMIHMIDKNPDLLDNLSISKLEKINNYYDKRIEEMNLKLKKLKKVNG